MKTAVFMRHGHAAEGPDDHARELTQAGRQAARAAALELREQGFRPDVIFCSTAERALATAEIVAQVLAQGVTLEPHRELYLASPQATLAKVRSLPDEHERLLVVGHNPGLEDLGFHFGEPRSLAPAGFFTVRRDVDRWQEFCA